jgi:hypothetical protein
MMPAARTRSGEGLRLYPSVVLYNPLPCKRLLAVRRAANIHTEKSALAPLLHPWVWCDESSLLPTPLPLPLLQAFVERSALARWATTSAVPVQVPQRPWPAAAC